jgi:hypothetical protein
MKKILLTLTVSLFAASTSMAAKQLLCRGVVPGGAIIGNIQKIEVKSPNLQSDSIYEISTAVQFEDYKGKNVAVGRRDIAYVDKNYHPRVYTNSLRYDLEQLIDTKTFSNFLPADQCHMSLMLPHGAETMTTFPAPMVINCDQSGGSITLQCKVY